MALSTFETSFVTIGKGIYLFKPGNPGAVDSAHPTVILIFGWMGAKLHHLQKYTSVYRKQYSNTTIILVQSEPSFFWSIEFMQHKVLGPVVEILEAVGCIPPSQRCFRRKDLQHSTPLAQHRVLVHVFSNGGCFQLITLAKLLSKRQIEGASTTCGIIFDSCPGSGSFRGSQRAFSSVITNPIARFLVKIMVALLFCIQFFMKHVFRKQPYFQAMKSSLNDPNVLPWTSKRTPRLYIYSEGDELVEADVVEEHVKDAREIGLTVSVEKFGKESKHVSHVRADPQRYWTSVGQLWKEALELGEKEV